LGEEFEVVNARLIDIRKELVRGRSSHVQISAISGQTQPLREPIESELPLGLMGQESFESLSIYEIFPSQDEGSTHNDAGSIVWLKNELGSKVVQGAVEQSAPDSFELSAETLAKIDEELAEIVTRPWWTRSWVIQEIALSREVVFQCGNVLASSKGVYSVVEHEPQGSFPPVAEILRVWAKNNENKRNGSTK
jgi:hypothetical protein